MTSSGRTSLAATLVMFTAGLAATACVPPPPGGPTAAATQAPATIGPTALPSFVRPTPLPAPTFLAYEVKPGDTLTSISNAFSTTAVSIGYWNRDAYPSLDPDSDSYAPDRIEVGWTLLIIPEKVVDGSDLPEASPSAAPSPT